VINLAAPTNAAMEAVQTMPMAQDLFNYASLDPAHADEARRTAELIRRRLLSSYIDTGADLLKIKDKIEHGAFGAWVKAEFCFTERTAENFMNAARLAREYEIISELPPTIVYLLAAPSAPAAFVADVLAEAKKGIIPRVREIKTRLAEAIKAQRRADIDAAERPELVVSALPRSSKRDASELELRILLGAALRVVKGPTASGIWTILHPALALARSLQRNDSLGIVHGILYDNVSSQGRVAEALQWVEERLNVAEALGDADQLARARNSAAHR